MFEYNIIKNNKLIYNMLIVYYKLISNKVIFKNNK